jgi:hypothetical protein
MNRCLERTRMSPRARGSRCGTDTFVEYAPETGFTVYGFDFSVRAGVAFVILRPPSWPTYTPRQPPSGSARPTTAAVDILLPYSGSPVPATLAACEVVSATW